MAIIDINHVEVHANANPKARYKNCSLTGDKANQNWKGHIT